MDIDILLFLQRFRDGIGAFLADFLSKMTYLGEVNTVLFVMAVLYWVVEKEFGTYLMMGWNGSRLVNGVLKVTFCVYRPWIRDPRIIPYGDSMKSATGYSFPSGHSMNAASVYGGSVLRREFPRSMRIALGVLTLLVMFSRLYLGVHTPQDVLIGAGAGLLVMWLTLKLTEWLKAHPEKDMMVFWIGLFLAAAAAAYAGMKPYPADYDAQGNLLVDGAKMANDTFKGIGWCAGFLAGWILERRFVGFVTEVSRERKLARLVIGTLFFYVVSLLAVPAVTKCIPGPAGTLISCMIQMICIVFVFPWCFKRLEKREE